MTPFVITFSRKPPTYPQYISGTSNIDAVHEILSQREAIFELLRRKLLKAQDRMKTNTDRHRRDQEFKVGDCVIVKLRPQRQTSVTGTTYSKLGKQYYDPFQVTECMGKVAYKVQLPEYSRIHPIFHVSLLKPYIATTTAPAAVDLPPLTSDNHPVVTPLAIVASKVIPSETGPKHMVLVQWQGLPPEETSWEEWSVLKSLHHLEDKVLLEGHGSVTRKDTKGVPLAKEVQVETRTRPLRVRSTPAYLKEYERSHAEWGA